MSTLYIIATPIGNLEDVTYRAVRILSEVDLIVCENVSESHRLLEKYEIKTSTSVLHANSLERDIDKFVALLKSGKTLAYISDAGTPCISDPGTALVRKVLEENKNIEDPKESINVVTVPGASALTAAVSISGEFVGTTDKPLIFYGFVPHKKGRETLIKKINEDEDSAHVMYESVHRIEKLLESLSKVLAENRKVLVFRELTKIYEEVVRGSAAEVRDYFVNNQDKVRGEFVVMIN